jgi:hypothetical protein
MLIKGNMNNSVELMVTDLQVIPNVLRMVLWSLQLVR